MCYTLHILNDKEMVKNTLLLKQGYSNLYTVRVTPPISLKLLTKRGTIMHYKAMHKGSYIFDDNGVLQEFSPENTFTTIDVTNFIFGLDTGSFVPRNPVIIKNDKLLNIMAETHV